MSEFDIILDKSQRNLKEIPRHVLDMFNLKMLYLQSNEIDFLPDDFFLRLHKLTWLDLRNNRLKCIPETIAYHQNLENLLLSDNRIAYLPNELGLVPKLSVLQIGNNPILYPSRKIIAQGTAAICRFLHMEYEKLNPVLDTRIPEDMSVTRIEEEIPTVRRIHSQAPSKSRTSLTIRSLSRPEDKIIHQISKGVSKISLRSFYDSNVYVKTGTQTSDDTLLTENLKNQWLFKLKTLLAEQEKILQQEKNLRTLDSWRSETRLKPIRKVSRAEMSAAPFGTYEEYNAMLSREEIAKEVDRFMLNPKKPAERPDTAKLISSLISQLKEFENYSRDDRSPRTEMYESGQQILKMVDIHRKIMELQQKNF